jgi:hypothetical protein
VDIYNQIYWTRVIEKQDKPSFREIELDIDLEKLNKKRKKIVKLEQESKILYILKKEKVLKMKILQKEEKRCCIYLCEYKCILNCKNELYMKKMNNENECNIWIFEREMDYRKKIRLSF